MMKINEKKGSKGIKKNDILKEKIISVIVNRTEEGD